MIRLNYRFKLLSPLAHGGEGKTSNVRLFRRQRVRVRPDRVIEHKSKFQTEAQRRNAIAAILDAVYESVPQERKKVTIWDEFTARTHIAAVQAQNQFEWLNRICQSFGIASLYHPQAVGFLEQFGADEFLTTLRDELQYLIAFMRLHRERRRAGDNEQIDGGDNQQDEPTLAFKKFYEDIPFVAGNAIRGKMRRLLMYDFCKRIGLQYDIFGGDQDGGIRMPESMYHRLMTGGNLTDATGWEDIEKREQLIRMCPPIGLLGSAIGNMTIRGRLGVGDAQLVCFENGSGPEPYPKFIDIDFGTRHDTSKTETEIPFMPDGKNGKTTAQMIYYNEVIIRGAEFDHHFVLHTENPILQSVFAHMLNLFRQYPYLGGLAAKERGEIGLSNLSLDNLENTAIYLDYVKNNKESILSFFTRDAIESTKMKTEPVEDE